MQKDLRELDFDEEFDLVLNLNDGAIGYFETEEENHRTFEVIAAALRPGGGNLLQLPNVLYAETHLPQKTWIAGEGMVELIDHRWDARTRYLEGSTMPILVGEAFEGVAPIPFRQRLYSVEELTEIYDSVGMDSPASFGARASRARRRTASSRSSSRAASPTSGAPTSRPPASASAPACDRAGPAALRPARCWRAGSRCRAQASPSAAQRQALLEPFSAPASPRSAQSASRVAVGSSRRTRRPASPRRAPHRQWGRRWQRRPSRPRVGRPNDRRGLRSSSLPSVTGTSLFGSAWPQFSQSRPRTSVTDISVDVREDHNPPLCPLVKYSRCAARVGSASETRRRAR